MGERGLACFPNFPPFMAHLTLNIVEFALAWSQAQLSRRQYPANQKNREHTDRGGDAHHGRIMLARFGQ